MATFIVQGRFSAEGIRGMVAKPEDRSKVVAKLIAAAGGKLRDYYMTTGEYDFLIIAEAPDGEDAVVASLAAAASGSVAHIRTVRAWKAKDFKDIAARAGEILSSYRAPGS